MKTLPLLFLALALGVFPAAAEDSPATARIWHEIDSLNRVFRSRVASMPEPLLEGCFVKAVEILRDPALGQSLESAREAAIIYGNYREMDAFTERCRPAIDLFVLGESDNIGINIPAFIERCHPDSRLLEFFLLARDGFFITERIPGTAHFPKWIERTESSFQGRILPERARRSLALWKAVRPNASGIFADIARETIATLEPGP